MIRRFSGSAVALLAIAVFAAGCGSGSKKSGTTAGTQAERIRTACNAPANTKPTGLPAAFPLPGELTVTHVRKDGPTIVVEGYWNAPLDEIYNEYKDAVTRAGYKILFTENEHRDAEISYKGSARTGQIALRDDCTESGAISVHITNRPA
ncbi:MAG: hypothetical protein QOG59_518 [Solirubrobacteraceae bacterium]|nr:hypothetical protein [Solirubrobacteraceae bacterium]